MLGRAASVFVSTRSRLTAALGTAVVLFLSF